MTVFRWLIPLFINLWWRCALSGKKGERPCKILKTITAIMSNIGTEKRIIGMYIAVVEMLGNSKEVFEKDIIETNANKEPNK